jgi:hypothetical protein
MNKPTRVILIGEAKEEFQKLNKIVGQQMKDGKEKNNEIQLLRSVKQKFDFLKANPFYGDSIEKRKIPKNYEVANLWRVELSKYWRMLYTIKGDQVEIICFVLEIIDHKKYDKLFGYKKK